MGKIILDVKGVGGWSIIAFIFALNPVVALSATYKQSYFISLVDKSPCTVEQIIFSQGLFSMIPTYVIKYFFVIYNIFLEKSGLASEI